MKIRMLSILVIVVGMSSCTEREVRLSVNDRQIVDTIYLSRLDSLRPLWDTLCATNRVSMLQHTVDSLVRTRREEEARIRERIKQQVQQ